MNKLIDKSQYFKFINNYQTRYSSYHFLVSNSNNSNGFNNYCKRYVTDNSNISSSGEINRSNEFSIDTNDDIQAEWNQLKLSKKLKVKKCVLTGQERIPKSVKDISFLNKHGLLVKLNSSTLSNEGVKDNIAVRGNIDNEVESDNGEEVVREEYNDIFEVIKTKKQKKLEKELLINHGADNEVNVVLENDGLNLIQSSKKKKKENIDNQVNEFYSDENINNIKQTKKSKKKLNNSSNDNIGSNEEVLLEIDPNEMNRDYNLDENGDHIVTMSPGFDSPDLNRLKLNLEKPLKESVKKSRKKKDQVDQQTQRQEEDSEENVVVKSKSRKSKKELESQQQEEGKAVPVDSSKLRKSKKELESIENKLDQVKSVGIESLKSKKKKEKVDEYLNIIDVYKEWKENVLIKASNEILKSKIKLPKESFKMSQHSNNSSNQQENILEKEHEWDKLVESCNKMVFGNKEFRPLQKQVINSILHGRDTFVSLPTGGGKSLCFQIPSIVDKSGISFIVSPLLSLMQDQVHKLKLLGIPACSINSSNTVSQNKKTIAQLLDRDNCNIPIVYISPERLAQPEFLQVLQELNDQGRIKRLIVDEAHCISEWGHDFRPAYRKISLFRENFPNIPISAFTATAKPSVENDIKNELQLQHPITISSSFLRTNLIYQIRSKSQDQYRSFSDIADYIKYNQADSCGIIYCATTSDCEVLSQFLNELNIDSHYYHGSLKNSERIEIQKAWTNKSFKIIVTTLAFGMGIDVGDVRFIIHYTMPSSIEAYYQQTGRAGRDGLKSECILYYSSNDYFKISRIIQTQSSSSSNLMSSDELEYAQYEQLQNQKQQMGENKVELLDSINSFCRNDTECRRVQLLDYFGEVSKPCKTNCDICISNKSKSGFYPLKKLKQDIKSTKDTIERVYTRNSYSTFHLKKNKNKNKTNKNHDNDDY